MKHLVEAHDAMLPEIQEHIEVNTADHSVTFTIQDGPIKEVGENGCQALDIIKFSRLLITSLDQAFPSEYNKATIRALSEAIAHQEARTDDRIRRDVEGYNKA